MLVGGHSHIRQIAGALAMNKANSSGLSDGLRQITEYSTSGKPFLCVL